MKSFHLTRKFSKLKKYFRHENLVHPMKAEVMALMGIPRSILVKLEILENPRYGTIYGPVSKNPDPNPFDGK